jgi:hypothetical protein
VWIDVMTENHKTRQGLPEEEGARKGEVRGTSNPLQMKAVGMEV